MSHNTEPESRIDRRTFIKGVGATGTLAVGMGSTRGPVGEAEAIGPLALGGLAAGAGVGAGWLVRSIDPLGSDDPEGTTPEALQQSIYQQALQLESHIGSTYTNNQNIVTYLEDTVYTEAKVAAIERAGDGLGEDALFNQAMDEVRKHHSTVLENLLGEYNEMIDSLKLWIENLQAHPDLSPSDMISGYTHVSSLRGYTSLGDEGIEYEFVEVELPNGEPFEVYEIGNIDYGYSYNNGRNPYEDSGVDAGDDRGWCDFRIENAGGDYAYLPQFNTADDYRGDGPYHEDWYSMVEIINDAFDQIENELETWVYNVYEDISDGSIDIAEAAGPLGMAELASEDEGTPMAAADLRAMGVPVDTDRETTIELVGSGITLRGQLGVSGDRVVEAGTSINPADEDESYFITYDTSLAEGVWSGDNYEANLSQGELVFYEEPLDGVEYHVTNTDDETAVVTYDTFEADADPWDDPEEWTVDLSDQLDNAGGTVLEIEFYDASSDVNFETIELVDEFDIISITNADGEEVETAGYETREPQENDNYISQDEWDELRNQNQELIEKYEDAQNNDLLGGIGDWDGIDEIPGGAAAAAGVAVVLVLFGALRQIASLYLPGK